MKLNHPEIIFVIFGFLFGILMIFLTPYNQVPDEHAHFLRAKEVSRGILYNKPPEKMTQVELENSTYEFHGASGYSPVMYAASGLGIKIFKDNIYAGRICNLLIWILLIGIAIKITPVFKWLFFFTALLPMSIYEGMSLSADSFSNAFAFLFLAYIFKLIYQEKEFSYKKDLPLLAIFGIIGALSKGIMYPLFLIPFIPIKKNKYLIFLTLISITFITSYFWSTINYLATPPVIIPEYNKSFILYVPCAYMLMLLNTIKFYFCDWVIGAIGILGNLTIRLDYIMYYLTIALAICNIKFIPEKHRITPAIRIAALLIFIGYVFITCTLLFIMTTPVGGERILGIQGRYFIPAIPLLFIIFGQNINNNNDKYSEMFKRITIRYIFLLLCYTCFILYRVYLV